MGLFLPVFLAFILNSRGYFIFVAAKLPGCGPYLSMLVFMFAAFILLWDVRLYPTSLRKLGWSGTYLIQFFVSTFLMEHLVSDFWLPLEEAVIAAMPQIATFEIYLVRQSGWDIKVIGDFFQKKIARILASYALSTFFLMSVLHATRIIDFRLLRCGITVFFKDIFIRAKKAQRKLLQSIGLAQPKCVKFDDEDDFCPEQYYNQYVEPNFDNDPSGLPDDFEDRCPCPRSRRRRR